MKKFLAAAIAVFLLFSCETDKKSEIDLPSFIPANSEFIIHSPDFSSFIENIGNIPILKQNPEILDSIPKEVIATVVQDYKLDSGFLSITNQKDFLFITDEKIDQQNLDSIPNKEVETLTENDFTYKKLVINNHTFYSNTYNKITLISNTKTLLQNIVKNPEKRIPQTEAFKKAMTAADKSKTSLFLNFNLLEKEGKSILKELPFPFLKLSNWWELDFEEDEQNLFVSGVATWQKDSQKLMKIFQDVVPQENKMAFITPQNAEGFISYSYKNFSQLKENLQKFSSDSTQIKEDHFLNYTNEAGIISLKDSRLFVLNTTDKELAVNSIPNLEKTGEYRDISIYKVPEHLQLQIFSPLLKISESKLCCFLDNFMIFGSQQELEDLISHFINKNTLGNQQYYQQSISRLAGNSSILAVVNTIDSDLPNPVSEKYQEKAKNLDFKGYPLLALQFIQNSNFAHIHLLLNQGNISEKEEVEQNSTIKLDTKLGTAPVLVENHNNHHPEIAVQDENNVLYLYTMRGTQLWNNKLDGRILGNIQQVDLYRNGNLQLIFTTPHSLYLIDRNGKNVKPFPMEFHDEITQPLAIYDYDNNRKYRFVITQNRELLMLNSDAKTVTGFHFEKASSKIAQPPKHLRIRNKDYIVFPEENGKLDILSRQGKTRISIKEKLQFSSNQWYQNSGDFVSIDGNGKLVRIDQNGHIQYKDISKEEEPKLAATAQILAILEGNILHINKKEVTLDYGLYTAPKIFKVRGKFLISITDLQAKKVYVFDENANLLPGFPMYGTSAAELSNFDGGHTELTVKGEDNSVLIYSF